MKQHRCDLRSQAAALTESAAGIVRRLEQRLCSEAAPCQQGVASLLKALLDTVKQAKTSTSAPAAVGAAQQPSQPSRCIGVHSSLAHNGLSVLAQSQLLHNGLSVLAQSQLLLQSESCLSRLDTVASQVACQPGGTHAQRLKCAHRLLGRASQALWCNNRASRRSDRVS